MHYFAVVLTIIFGFGVLVKSEKDPLQEACENIEYTWEPDYGCYKIYNFGTDADQYKNWTEARKTCINEGTDLVYVKNAEDARALYVLMWKKELWRTWAAALRNEDGKWLTANTMESYEPKGCDENLMENSTMGCHFKHDTSEKNNCLAFYSYTKSTALQGLDCTQPIESFICRMNLNVY